jgi:hypothetical protein
VKFTQDDTANQIPPNTPFGNRIRVGDEHEDRARIEKQLERERGMKKISERLKILEQQRERKEIKKTKIREQERLERLEHDRMFY